MKAATARHTGDGYQVFMVDSTTQLTYVMSECWG